MRLGVVMTGHMRSYRLCVDSLFQHLVGPGNMADFFIDTWPTLGFRSDRPWDAHDVPIDELDVWRTYAPREVVVREVGTEETVGCSPRSMFERMFLCNERRRAWCLRTGVDHDVVVRCRPDLLFTSFPGYGGVDEGVFIPAGEDHNGTNDQIAWGRPAAMDRYFAVGQYPSDLHPETQLKEYLARSGISPVRPDGGFYRIVRHGDPHLSHLER